MKGWLIFLLVSLSSAPAAADPAESRSLIGLPQLHRYDAGPRPAGTLVLTTSLQQAIIPMVGVGESLSVRAELFGPWGLSIGSDGYGTSRLGSIFVRWRLQLASRWSLSTEAAYEQLDDVFELWSFSEETEELERVIRQDMHVRLLDVGATLTWRIARLFALSLGYGWQAGVQRGSRECGAVVYANAGSVASQREYTCDDALVLPDHRERNPQFHTVALAVHFGTERFGLLLSVVESLTHPIGDVPLMAGTRTMLGIGVYGSPAGIW